MKSCFAYEIEKKDKLGQGWNPMTDETSSMFPHEYMNKKTGTLNKSGRDDLTNLNKNKKKI